jgi:DeoR/GlpR family transcriptional regulator of sugar metabolism
MGSRPIAQALRREMAVTVITNAPAVALALSDHDKCRTILLGGILNQDKGGCLGGQTLNEVRRIYADVFVLGTCGVDASVGVTALDAEEAELKRTMVEQSGQLVVPATADKIGTIAPYSVAVAPAIDTLISSIADEVRLSPFRELGAKVHIAP